MKRNIQKHVNYILGLLLGLLGFQSCDEIGGSVCEEYGVPYATFSVKGSVTDSQGKPLAGEKVVVDNPKYPSYTLTKDTIKTSANGDFVYGPIDDFPSEKLRVKVFDTTGKYENDSIDITLTKTEKGKGWYDGKYEGSADFKLKDKK